MFIQLLLQTTRIYNRLVNYLVLSDTFLRLTEMMLTAVLFCITWFKFTSSLPPLSTNFNSNNKVVTNPQNRYNERFLQYRQGAPLVNENVGLQNSQIYPQLDKNLNTASHAAYVRAYGQSGQNFGWNGPVTQNIGVIDSKFERATTEQFLQRPLQNPNTNNNFVLNHNFENGFNERQKVKQPSLASNNPQNFQINLRGYVASPEISSRLVPPKPNLPNPFLPTTQGNTQRMIQSPSQMLTGIHNSAYDVKRPIFGQPISTVTDLHISPSAMKKYTIIYPNGTTEQSDSLEAIKKNYPNYMLRNLSDINKNHKLIKEDYVVTEKGVNAKHALANPTLVPIFNVPSPVFLPKDYPKETLVTNTFSEGNPSRLTPTLVTEHINLDKKYSSKVPLKYVTSGNISSSTDSTSQTIILTTQSLRNASVDLNKNTLIASVPSMKETSMKLTTAINKTEKEDENIKYDALKNINADDFWDPVKNIIQFPDFSNVSDTDIRKMVLNSLNANKTYEEIQPFDENLNTTNTEENKNTIIGKLNPDISVPRENKTDPNIYNQTDNDTFSSIHSQLPLNKTSNESINFESDIEDEEKLYDSEQDRIDEFVRSIEDMIEFIEPFVETENETEDNETIFNDNVPDKTYGTNNESDLHFDDFVNKNSQMNQSITEPIYIPNLSVMKDNDTMFWFKTTDENVWEKLSKKNGSNFFIIPPPISVEKDRSITVYPNGTKVEEITEITRSDNGKQPTVLKTITITQPNGETEIKYS